MNGQRRLRLAVAEGWVSRDEIHIMDARGEVVKHDGQLDWVWITPPDRYVCGCCTYMDDRAPHSGDLTITECKECHRIYYHGDNDE
jgi:hypothetical protein